MICKCVDQKGLAAMLTSRVGVPSLGHFFQMVHPIQTHIFTIFKILVKNLYIVCVPF